MEAPSLKLLRPRLILWIALLNLCFLSACGTKAQYGTYRMMLDIQVVPDDVLTRRGYWIQTDFKVSKIGASAFGQGKMQARPDLAGIHDEMLVLIEKMAEEKTRL